MMFVDSHCHLDRLDLTPFDGQLSKALATAKDNSVTHFLCVSIDLDSWPAMYRQVADYPQVAISVGVHPSTSKNYLASVAELTELAKDPRVVAIGETGLDYFHGKDPQARERQETSFRTHIAAAKQVNKPLIIHAREAREATLQILSEEGADQVGGVFHCFTEDWPTAERALALNFYISFSGIVTFRNAQQIKEVAQRVPANRMLIETDSPYLAPVPYRGKSNQPAWVRHVAECVAELRNEPLPQVAQTTSANFFDLFGYR
jgi:TatD DNase family protein